MPENPEIARRSSVFTNRRPNRSRKSPVVRNPSAPPREKPADAQSLHDSRITASLSTTAENRKFMKMFGSHHDLSSPTESFCSSRLARLPLADSKVKSPMTPDGLKLPAAEASGKAAAGTSSRSTFRIERAFLTPVGGTSPRVARTRLPAVSLRTARGGGTGKRPAPFPRNGTETAKADFAKPRPPRVHALFLGFRARLWCTEAPRPAPAGKNFFRLPSRRTQPPPRANIQRERRITAPRGCHFRTVRVA